jgi:DNA-binding Lrp family transcriptional regulator
VITSSRKAHREESSAPKQSIPEEDLNVSYQSRLQILEELDDIGLNTSSLDSLPIYALRNMLTNVHGLLQANRSGAGRLRSSSDSVPFLSNSDKKMIECLLTTDGFVTSKDLSKKLNIPLSTIQRRRKRLEAIFIQRQYTLRMEKMGYRTATLFISTSKRSYNMVGKEILEGSDMVTFVFATIGQSGMDLKVEVVFKTSQDLMSLIDEIKSLEGVRSVFWSESVMMIGRKNRYSTIF